jgi:Metallo-beta-lactamase superfamily
VFLVDGAPYVVDCGPRVTSQLVAAGVPLQSVRKIFITHHHNDHNIEYGNVVNLAWTNGLNHRIESYGPPPLKRMTGLFWELNERDIGIRMADEGRPDPRTLLVATEIERPGVVYEDEGPRHRGAGQPPADRAALRLPLRRGRALHRLLRRHHGGRPPDRARPRRGRAAP